MGTNCFCTDEFASMLASRFRQNNESPQNISPYESAVSEKSIIMLATFYFVHSVSKSSRASNMEQALSHDLLGDEGK